MVYTANVGDYNMRPTSQLLEKTWKMRCGPYCKSRLCLFSPWNICACLKKQWMLGARGNLAGITSPNRSTMGFFGDGDRGIFEGGADGPNVLRKNFTLQSVWSTIFQKIRSKIRSISMELSPQIGVYWWSGFPIGCWNGEVHWRYQVGSITRMHEFKN